MIPKKMKAAELLNGRAAMLGCSIAGFAIFMSKTGLMQSSMPENIQAIWKAIGVYA
tara:strand:+ start:747 stop:914 length:168 start_codon:yes stop_codon:yes gene_type:complete